MYDGKTNAGVVQDKYPPRRMMPRLVELQSAGGERSIAMNTKNG